MKNKLDDELLKRDEKIPQDSAIYLENLSFGYSEILNLENITVDIKKGEYVSVIGHNGCGKSTMAKLIDGILIQNSGEIYISGIKMTDNNALKLRKSIGMVFQNPDSQFIGATVKDDIAFGLENDQVDPKEMDDIIKKCAKSVGMEDYLEAEPSNLSGGQKQRVAIAGMIARNPDILILDEAGAMLDPKGKREIREIIKQKKNANPNLTILNITHEIDEAYDSDRVLVLNDKKIVLDGKPQDVFENDELLKSISLDIPFCHKLVNELRKDGLEIDKISNEKELLDLLCPSK